MCIRDRTNVDAYRKLRNTLRYMIGALDGYDESEELAYEDMPALEKWVLNKLHEITQEHKGWVKGHEHRKIFQTLFNFCTLDLSAFYFDIRKDALYCDPLGSTRRRACRTVMHYIFERLTTWLAPIMCFTMEEVWQARNPSESHSVHMELYRDAPEEWFNHSLAHRMDIIRSFRSNVSEVIEPLRKDGKIRSSLEAGLEAPVDAEIVGAFVVLNVSNQNYYKIPSEPNDTVADYLIVSECNLRKRNTDLVEQEEILVTDLKTNSDYSKCERSWKYFKGEDDITPRDLSLIHI